MWRFWSMVMLPTLLMAQTAPELQTPTIRVNSRIVYVDIVVRDGRGQVVRGLTQNDFRVTEDGKPQKIDLFRGYSHEPAVAPVKRASSSPMGDLLFSNVSAGNRSSDTANMILFDLLDTSLTNQIYARKQMLKFLETLPPGHEIALFVLSDRLHMLQSFTGSSELLSQAASLLSPHSSALFQSSSEQARDADVLGLLPASMKSGGEGSFAMDLVDELAKEGFQHDQARVEKTNMAFRELAQATAAFTGRKNLIWLSESFPVGAVTVLQTFHSSLGSSLTAADLSGATVRMISDSRIAIYPISVAGLESGGGVNASLNGTTAAGGSGAALAGGGAMGNGTSTIDPETTGGEAAAQPGGQTGGARLPDTLGMQADSRQALRDQMDQIAEQTGGEAFAGNNDLAGAMRRSLEEGENYYSVAYSPTNQNWNSRLRKIHVELAQKGYSLSYRRGYFAFPEPAAAPANNAQELLVALEPSSPELGMIAIQSRVYLPDKQRDSLQVDALLGSKSIGFTVAADGSRAAQLLVELIAIPESKKGTVIGQTSETLNFHLTEAQYQVAIGSGLPVRLQMPLKPGRYQIRLGVSDMNTHRIGTVNMPVEIPPA